MKKSAVFQKLHQAFEKGLDVIYPPRCPFCGKISRTGICGSCRQSIPYVMEPCCMKCGKPLKQEEKEYCGDCARMPRAYEQGRSVWSHTGNVPRAIYQFKFHNKRYYAKIFAEEMAHVHAEWIRRCGIELIVPVPLHAARRRQRGFNQAELVARELGRKLEIPVDTKLVFRIRNTRPQKQLGGRERGQNLRGAFAVSRRERYPQKILLIDDIYTTGSTVHRIAMLLKKAGVQKVYFLTISIGQDN